MNQARNPSGTSGTRRLAAVLSADIVDYADLMRVDDVSPAAAASPVDRLHLGRPDDECRYVGAYYAETFA